MDSDHRAAVMLETVRDLLGARDSAEVLRRIASRAHGFLTRDTAAVYLSERGAMRAAAAEGLYARELAGETIEIGDGILGSIALSGRGEIVNDTLHDTRGKEVEGTPDTAEGEKLMGAPLVSNGAVIGVMAIWRGAEESPFSPEDLAALEWFSHLAVIAIENARSYEESEARVKRLSGLIEIGRALVSARDLSPLLGAVHVQMGRIFDTRNFYIATYVEGSAEWTWEFHYEDGRRQPVERHDLGTGVTGFILTSRRPILLRNRGEIARFLDDKGIRGLGLLPQSWMGVPLVAGEELTGVMAIQNYDMEDAYDDADLEYCGLIGTTVAFAIQNARLFESTKKAHREAEEATEEARRLLGLERVEHERSERLRAELEASIVDLREAQGRLVTAEKMAVLGGLVAGMAHEINTPIGVALTASTYQEEQVAELSALLAGNSSDALRFCLSGILESAKLTRDNLLRAAELIRSFKQVSVDQTSEARRRFALGPYIAEIIQSLRPRLKKTSIAIEVSCPGDLEIDSYPGAISQIITNFIINSMIHGFRDAQRDCAIRISAKAEGPAVVLEYADNGRGLDPESLKRIFDPFFTTMRGLGGTGLGTTIAYNLVTQRLGGTIEAMSEPGEGLRYLLRLPVIAPEENSSRPNPGSAR